MKKYMICCGASLALALCGVSAAGATTIPFDLSGQNGFTVIGTAEEIGGKITNLDVKVDGFKADAVPDYSLGADQSDPLDFSGVGFSVSGGASDGGASYVVFALGGKTYGWLSENAIGDYADGYITAGSSGLLGGVPEPTTWALMLIGIGALGAQLRRNKRHDGLAAVRVGT